jgi:hypothetical protein
VLQSSFEALATWWKKATSQEMLAQIHCQILYEALPDQWWGVTAPPGNSEWLTSTGTDRLEELLVITITQGNDTQKSMKHPQISLKL